MKKSTTIKDTVILEISGDKITAEKFSNSVRTFLDMIDEVATKVTGRYKAIDWIISVKSGSIGLCATADPIKVSKREAIKAVSAITRGMSAISKRSKKRPKYFSDIALEKLYHLGHIVGFGDKGISQMAIRTNGKSHELSPSSVSYVGDILKMPTAAYGTIDGELLALNVRGKPRFSIYETLSQKPVNCFFEDEVYTDVIAAIKKRVSVYGVISYHRDGDPASVEIKSLRVFPEQSELPQFDDIIGLLKD
ncbi:MAG: hypothetical protein ABSF37_08325 [Sedimentisphaerales bacterium]|jgi:hypothetical protein